MDSRTMARGLLMNAPRGMKSGLGKGAGGKRGMEGGRLSESKGREASREKSVFLSVTVRTAIVNHRYHRSVVCELIGGAHVSPGRVG